MNYSNKGQGSIEEKQWFQVKYFLENSCKTTAWFMWVHCAGLMWECKSAGVSAQTLTAGRISVCILLGYPVWKSCPWEKALTGCSCHVWCGTAWHLSRTCPPHLRIPCHMPPAYVSFFAHAGTWPQVYLRPYHLLQSFGSSAPFFDPCASDHVILARGETIQGHKEEFDYFLAPFSVTSPWNYKQELCLYKRPHLIWADFPLSATLNLIPYYSKDILISSSGFSGSCKGLQWRKGDMEMFFEWIFFLLFELGANSKFNVYIALFNMIWNIKHIHSHTQNINSVDDRSETFLEIWIYDQI